MSIYLANWSISPINSGDLGTHSHHPTHGKQNFIDKIFTNLSLRPVHRTPSSCPWINNQQIRLIPDVRIKTHYPLLYPFRNALNAKRSSISMSASLSLAQALYHTALHRAREWNRGRRGCRQKAQGVAAGWPTTRSLHSWQCQHPGECISRERETAGRFACLGVLRLVYVATDKINKA